jgi:hypothetical protein
MPSTQAQRILLTDKAVKSLPFAPSKPQIVRDSKIAGFHLWVGKSTKTFRFQYETPRVTPRGLATKLKPFGWKPGRDSSERGLVAPSHVEAIAIFEKRLGCKIFS